MAADQIQVGGGDLGVHIARVVRRVLADRLRIHRLHPGQQLRLGQAELGLRVGRVVGEHVLVRLHGAAEVVGVESRSGGLQQGVVRAGRHLGRGRVLHPRPGRR
ncbi:hypothetical protein SMICM17S_04913 [Streptomyces microflavus]